MSAQVRFFDKNIIDLSNTAASITVTDSVASNDGQDFVDFMRNRNNVSAWMTTGSNDSANTTLTVELGEGRDISDILLIGHNLAEYTIKYWDGGAYVDFSPAITQPAVFESSTLHTFSEVTTERIQIIITKTEIVDDDKKIKQLIVTNKVASGQLEGWPVIKRPTHNTNKKISNMLSGKVNVVESVGGFSMDLEVRNWNKDNDLTLVEEIYFGKRGVLVWLSGGDEDQFSHKRIGYRKEDIYFMRAVNNYTPEWASGIYSSGLAISLKMREAIE